jgi:hypothetical protein
VRIVVHQPTLQSPPSASGRVGAAVLAAVRAELARLDGGPAEEPVWYDAARGEDGSDEAEPSSGLATSRPTADVEGIGAEEAAVPREEHR